MIRSLGRVPLWQQFLRLGIGLLSYALLAAACMLSGHPVAWVAGWALMGFLMTGFVSAMHDCAHGSFSRDRRVNRVVGGVLGSLLVINFTLYKCTHLDHHRFTRTARDPERRYSFAGIGSYLRKIPTFTLSHPRLSLRAALGLPIWSVRRPDQKRQAFIDNAVQAACAAGTVGLTIVWPLPMLLIYWIPLLVLRQLIFFVSVSEHHLCEDVTDPWCNTRTITSNALFRYFFWNANYHGEHHLYPSLPSAALPRVAALIGQRFRYRESSVLGFHWRVVKGCLARTRAGLLQRAG